MTPEEMAEAHFDWLKGLLELIPCYEDSLDVQFLRYLYETAFVHGYKHGVESKTILKGENAMKKKPEIKCHDCGKEIKGNSICVSIVDGELRCPDCARKRSCLCHRDE